ncbi:MAG: ABC transporter permease [Lachnospira sp.]|nr:ABC transporter permease [Lachnospira sp.]
MNRVLRKRLLRDLQSNFMRYLALILLIVMGMYIVISVVGAAETVISGSTRRAEENCVEDGQFSVFLPLTKNQEKEITDNGILLEKMFSMDLEAEDGSILRLMKNRESMNLIDLDNGRLAKTSGEIVLEKRYCQEHDLTVSDNIKVADMDFEIVGIGSTPDYDMPIQNFSDMAVESSFFGIGFVTREWYEDIKNSDTTKAEEYCYAYRLDNSGMTDEDVKQIIKDIDNLTSFVKKGDNPRILGAAGDMQMNKEAGLFAGVIVMVLFTYVISVFVIHQIQQESSVIGALYALGAKKGDLLCHYVSLPTIITFIGGLIGAALGFSKLGIPVQMEETYNYFSVPELSAMYPAYLLVYSIVMPPLVSVIVNVLVINKRLSKTALSLIKNEQKAGNYRNWNLGKMGFVRRFQFRQMLREQRTGFTVIFGMIISLLVLMLGLNCYMLCENVQKDSTASTKFEYMYTLKYPPKEVPQDGEACYIETLSKTSMGYTLDISVIGIDDDNKYYDVDAVKGKSNIIIGTSMQQKYGLHVGDKLILTDNAGELDYAFTIKGITDYANGLAVFMDIESMRELFGQDEDYYNMVLSKRALDIKDGSLYSVTTKEDVKQSASVFTSLMMPMVVMMTVAAVIIFCMVLYLMMGVMVDRASFGISLIQVFGFRTGEIKKLYLNGNTWIVAAGAVIGIPLAKVIMNALYPWLVANVACGMNLRFPWYLYVGIFAGVMVVYFIINALLVRKLARITPAEVLKNRE